MTKRYYYKSSIAAAWMAQQFDMKFKSAGGQNLYYEGGTDFRCENDGGGYGGGYYYVHPDSLHLIEPQKDDMVDLGDHGVAFVVERKDNNIDCALFDASTGQFMSGYWHRRWVPIIKRGSVIFHMPESGEEE